VPGVPAADIPPAPRRAVNLTVMTNDEIERHLTALFGRRGYTVWPVPSRGEVAAAILICRGEQGVVVQVKRWNAALGPEVVRAVVAAVQYHAGTLGRLGCSQIGGMVVSTATFNDEAREMAAASAVLLWDRPELEAQLQADLARPFGADRRGGRA
jgi:HJR/Mrr/RecB family endonuclease